MKEVILEKAKDRVDAIVKDEVQKAKILDIRNLMTNLKFTVYYGGTVST